MLGKIKSSQNSTPKILLLKLKIQEKTSTTNLTEIDHDAVLWKTVLKKNYIIQIFGKSYKDENY